MTYVSVSILFIVISSCCSCCFVVLIVFIIIVIVVTFWAATELIYVVLILGTQYVRIIQNRFQYFYSISLLGKWGIRLDCSNSSLIKLINTEDIFVTYFNACRQYYVCCVDYCVLIIKQCILWDNRWYSARCVFWSIEYCNTVVL